MLPKKGCSGMVTPGPKSATILSRSSGMIFTLEYGKSSVRKPAPKRKPL